MLAKDLVQSYYNYFNQQDVDGMISCLHPDFVHDVNEGNRNNGFESFRKFMFHMNDCYKENLTEICIMTNDIGDRASAEFIVNGIYLKTDGNLPEAKNQKYVIKAGTFFEIKDSKILRVTTYYNLKHWIKQVS